MGRRVDTRHGQQGVTLIEMVIAITVLGIAIAGFGLAFPSLLQTWGSAADQQDFTRQAVSCMEVLTAAHASAGGDFECTANGPVDDVNELFEESSPVPSSEWEEQFCDDGIEIKCADDDGCSSDYDIALRHVSDDFEPLCLGL